NWTGDNTIQTGTVSAPIQDLGITGCNTATALSTAVSDYNDWINLNYNFTSSGSFNGVYTNPAFLAEITAVIAAEQQRQMTAIYTTVDNTSPRWGIDPVGVSGTATNFAGTDKIIIN